MKTIYLLVLSIGLGIAGLSPAIGEAQLGCAPLPPPTGTVIEVVPSQAGQLRGIINGVSPGTTILLHDGTYDMSNGDNSSRLTFGTANVTLRSFSGNRGAVVLDGNYQTNELVSIYASNVTIADLTVKRAYHHPIHISGSQGSPITGTVIHNVRVVDPRQQAIKINASGNGWADYGVVQCSSIELTSVGRSQVSNCYTGGIDAHSARGWIVRRNRIQGFWCANGLSEHGVHFWSASRDTLVEQNVIVDCARGIGFGLGSEGSGRDYPDDPYPGVNNKGHIDGVIRNNFISATNSGLFSSQYGFDTGIGLEQATGALVLHNSVASSQDPVSSSIEWRFSSTSAEIANNLTTFRLLARNGGQANLQGNISSAQTNWFESVAGGDLHLQPSGSEAVDEAVSLPVGWADRDFDHHLRGSVRDVGADEAVEPIFEDGFESGDWGDWIVTF